MRRLAPLLLPLLLLGCPGPPSFLVRIDVTVPQDVQAAFSSTSPAMVMVGTSPLAELCDPTGVPFTVQYSRTVSGHHCPETFGTNATQVSVVALSQGDIRLVQRQWAHRRLWPDEGYQRPTQHRRYRQTGQRSKLGRQLANHRDWLWWKLRCRGQLHGHRCSPPG